MKTISLSKEHWEESSGTMYLKSGKSEPMEDSGASWWESELREGWEYDAKGCVCGGVNTGTDLSDLWGNTAPARWYTKKGVDVNLSKVVTAVVRGGKEKYHFHHFVFYFFITHFHHFIIEVWLPNSGKRPSISTIALHWYLTKCFLKNGEIK